MDDKNHTNKTTYLISFIIKIIIITFMQVSTNVNMNTIDRVLMNTRVMKAPSGDDNQYRYRLCFAEKVSEDMK